MTDEQYKPPFKKKKSVKDLLDIIDRLKAGNAEKEKRIRDLGGLVEERKDNWDVCVARITDLDQEVKEKHNRIVELEAKLKAKQNEINALYRGDKRCIDCEEINELNDIINGLGKELTVIKDIIENDACDTCKYLLKKYIAREMNAPKPSVCVTCPVDEGCQKDDEGNCKPKPSDDKCPTCGVVMGPYGHYCNGTGKKPEPKKVTKK